MIIRTLLLLLMAHIAHAQVPLDFKKSFYLQKGTMMPYRLLYPEGYSEYEKYPLVLFLHGSGARGKDNEAQLTNLPAAFTDSAVRSAYPCFILVPQCAKEDSWVNFPEFPGSLNTPDTPTVSARLTLALVEDIVGKLNIDKSRIYITGYSMGGEGTFEFLSRKPHLFAAAIPVCSVADTSKAAVIKHVPTWIFHGDKDVVNDVKYSRIMVEALKNAGGQPKYTEYAGVGHRCWDNAYSDPGLFSWLFAQQRHE